MDAGVAAVVAGLLTLFDLDRTFYVPKAGGQKARLWAWWWGFIVANAAAAAIIDRLVVPNVPTLNQMNAALAGLVIGVSYLAILRAKLATFSFQGNDYPFGLEALYNAARGFAYKRINAIAKTARVAETLTLGAAKNLQELATEVKQYIDQDALMSDQDKKVAKEWLLHVLNDAASNDLDKRAALASYVLSGARSS